MVVRTSIRNVDLSPTEPRVTGTPLARSRALVAAALASVAELARLVRESREVPASALFEALSRATFDGDTLLVAARPDAPPPRLAGLARTGGGQQIHAAVLALDTAVVILSTGDGRGPLDLFLAAGCRDEEAARLLGDRLAAAASALSVTAARLDLQARFVEAILGESDQSGPEATSVTLDAGAAREAALTIRAMLAGSPLAIASGNRRTLDTLFAGMTSGGAAD